MVLTSPFVLARVGSSVRPPFVYDCVPSSPLCPPSPSPSPFPPPSPSSSPYSLSLSLSFSFSSRSFSLSSQQSEQPTATVVQLGHLLEVSAAQARLSFAPCVRFSPPLSPIRWTSLIASSPQLSLGAQWSSARCSHPDGSGRGWRNGEWGFRAQGLRTSLAEMLCKELGIGPSRRMAVVPF